MWSLTLPNLAVSNILKHGKILWIIATSESVSNSCGVGSYVSLEMFVETTFRAVGAIALCNLCSRNQYDIHQRYSTHLETERKRNVCVWGDFLNVLPLV